MCVSLLTAPTYRRSRWILAAGRTGVYTVSRESERVGTDWPGGAVGVVVVWSAPERSVQLEKQARVLHRGDAFELYSTMRHDMTSLIL